MCVKTNNRHDRLHPLTSIAGLCLAASAWSCDEQLEFAFFPNPTTLVSDAGLDAPLACESAVVEPNDEAVSIDSVDTVINAYGVLSRDALTGTTTIELTDISALNHSGDVFDSNALAPNDLLLIVQMQGAQFATTDSNNHGALLDIGSAGLHEFVRVASVSGNSVQLSPETSPNGLRHEYHAAGHTQVVRVPELGGLNVSSGASIVAPRWDGRSGGVVAIAADDIVVDGAIDVSGRGFRGGDAGGCEDLEGMVYFDGYVTTDACLAGGAGESAGGYIEEYLAAGGSKGRAARLNGGGGANAANCAGGGGANASAANNWIGCGVTSDNAAWDIDPTCPRAVDTAGGGRGGYGWSGTAENPHTVPPGDERWGGALRPEAGGLGGRPMPIDSARRVFFGGGGGAGQANENDLAQGGRGGGLVYILANGVLGSGKIAANGESAERDDDEVDIDGQAGGGAGGTVIVVSPVLQVGIEAKGGSGGDFDPVVLPKDGTQLYGAGGGGGGGLVVASPQSSVDVTGGPAGIVTHEIFATFPENGAASGSMGMVTGVPACSNLSLCPLPLCGE